MQESHIVVNTVLALCFCVDVSSAFSLSFLFGNNDKAPEKCRVIQFNSELCGLMKINACVPSDTDVSNVQGLLGFETDANACKNIQGFQCRVSSHFNEMFCSGHEPGFCLDFRYRAMRDACVTDDDCDGLAVPQLDKPCCSDWRKMSPCTMTDEEYERGMEDGLCSNSTSTARCATSAGKAGGGIVGEVGAFVAKLFRDVYFAFQ